MGFFSDLKEDLSQAVNELMPDEKEATEEAVETTETVESVEEVAEEATEEAVVNAVEVNDEKSEDEFTAQLEEMLNQLEE